MQPFFHLNFSGVAFPARLERATFGFGGQRSSVELREPDPKNRDWKFVSARFGTDPPVDITQTGVCNSVWNGRGKTSSSRLRGIRGTIRTCNLLIRSQALFH